MKVSWLVGVILFVAVGISSVLAPKAPTLSLKNHLTSTGFDFVSSPTLNDTSIPLGDVVALARESATVPIKAEAIGTAYLVRYGLDNDKQPVWIVHFSGTQVATSVGTGGSVYWYENILVVLDADGRFLKAMGIPNEMWHEADSTDPFGIASTHISQVDP